MKKTFLLGILTLWLTGMAFGQAQATPDPNQTDGFDFGNQTLGTTSSPFSITVTNDGDATLHFSSEVISGTDFTQFTISSRTCVSTLAPADSCTLDVTFHPTSGGAKTAFLRIIDDAADSPQDVPLTGFGTSSAVGLNPTSINFGNINVGVSSSPQDITVTNTGTATLNITNISSVGQNPGSFTFTTTCGAFPATVAVSGSCTVSVTFLPGSAGHKVSSIVFTDDAPGNAQTVAVSGDGTNAGGTSSTSNIRVRGRSSLAGNVVTSGTGTTLPLGDFADLPQLWVNNKECVGTTSQTFTLPGSYPATQAGLNSAITQAETDRTNSGIGTLISIAHGSTLSGATTVVLKQTSGDTSTNCIIINSDTPLTTDQVACSHSTTTPIYADRNPGCTNDVTAMYTIETTNVAVSPISTQAGAHHYQISGGEFRIQSGVGGATNNSLVLLAIGSGVETIVTDIPSHIHLSYNYIHGYDSPNTQVRRGVRMGCYQHCSMTFNYGEQIHSTASDSQIVIGFNTGGPMKFVMNYLEGGSEALVLGGVNFPASGSNPHDVEIRRNFMGHDAAWFALSHAPNTGGSLNWWLKNVIEFKNGVRILVDGNRFERAWADHDQHGYLQLINLRGGGSGDLRGTIIHDITDTNNIFAHSTHGIQMSLRQTDTAVAVDMSLAGYRLWFDNNLMYDIGNLTSYPDNGGSQSYAIQIGAPSTGNYSCSMVRDSLGLTSTGTCSSQIGLEIGDLVRLAACVSGGASPDSVPSSFQVGVSSIGPPALSPTTFTGSTVTYVNPGTANKTATCSLTNAEGWPNFVKFSHNSIFASSSNSAMAFVFDSQTTAQFKRNLQIVDNIFASRGGNNSSGLWGAGLAEGNGFLNWQDKSTLQFHSNILTGRNGSVYTTYETGALANNFPGNGAGGAANLTGTVCTTNSPTSACVGASGLLNGITYDGNLADYHGYGLCHASGNPSPCTAASAFATGSSLPASDGRDRGADLTLIDAAFSRNKYPCTTYCGLTGPFTD